MVINSITTDHDSKLSPAPVKLFISSDANDSKKEVRATQSIYRKGEEKSID